ncbi:MAG TPA: hypothetical protein VFJ77_08965 [Gaiellaceae bacterium]|nr:hypothetical protein [Gaiellaceae bacterium]
MDRARRHQRSLSGLALGLLALCAELAGRSLTHRLDVGRHVGPLSYRHEDYYPFLVAGVKVAVALAAARVAWRFARASAAMRRAGAAPARAARVPIELSWRLWLASFLVTATIYLVQTDAESLAAGGAGAFAPWLHTSALPIFAVLAVLVAVLFRAVEGWLADVERIAADAVARARRLRGEAPAVPLRARRGRLGRRRRFGPALDSRPPPLAA